MFSISRINPSLSSSSCRISALTSSNVRNGLWGNNALQKNRYNNRLLLFLKFLKVIKRTEEDVPAINPSECTL